MANKREKLIRKLRDALDEDKTLQGDLGIQEVEEALLFLLEEGMPADNVLPEESKIRSGSRDRKGNPEFEAHFGDDKGLENQERAPAVNDEHVQAKPDTHEEHLGNPVDVTDNATDVVPSDREAEDQSEPARNDELSKRTSKVLANPVEKGKGKK